VRPIGFVARACCITVLAAMMTAAFATPASAAPPIIADDPAHRSPISVVGGSTYVVIENVTVVATQAACVVLVNHGPRTATRLTLSFAMADASGNVIGVDVVRLSGNFAPGARSRYTGGGTETGAPNGNCHAIPPPPGPRRPSFWYRPAPHAPMLPVAVVLVSAREVIFDDGSSFKTENVPQSGDRVMLPAVSPFSAPPPAVSVKDRDIAAELSPRVVVSRPPGAPVEIAEAFQQDFYRGRIGGLERGTCVVFTNRDGRPVKQVRINLAITDRSGTIAGVQTIDVTGAYVRVNPIDLACPVIPGWWTDQGFGYVPQGPRGPVVPIGTIVAVPIRVEFDDGTSWDALKPPQTGERITAP
jgi:hypothetical protein